MKVALVADWLPTFAGAEHVIASLCSQWPSAPLYTTVVNRGGIGPLDKADIRTGALQLPYRLLKNHKVLLPWMPRDIENIDLRKYDVIISSSHAIGKGIIPPSHAVHVCYCHTPMRYAWEMEEKYLDDFGVPKFLWKRAKKMLAKIRRWDLTTAKRVDVFIANSRTTQERIQRIYNRESIVIPPPVSNRFFCRDAPTGRLYKKTAQYYLAIGRMVPYKRFDLLIQTANEKKIPLKIAGKGQEESKLRQLAGDTVEFVGFVPDEELPNLYANAKALLFPQLEDAGVVPLEAQACGTPVIAYGKGGALDTVVEGVSGLFFTEQTVASLADAIERFEKNQFDPLRIRTHAEQFSEEKFQERILNVVDTCDSHVST